MTPNDKCRAANRIFTQAAQAETGEEKLWLAVVHTIVQDYFFWPMCNRQVDGKTVYVRMRPKQRKMQSYMTSRDFERVCWYANLDPEFVTDVIERLELMGR